eukprot:COSAG02_NODE_42704_length_382_cov_0.710247_1_plen_31_part_10
MHMDCATSNMSAKIEMAVDQQYLAALRAQRA